MASISKSIGSSVWVQKERSQCAELTEEYIEEFAYCAQNDLRWINAHMDELLNSDKLNLAEVLKTPGKLRGKTPRTARKHDPQRAPLTDLFAPDPQNTTSPAQSTPFFEKVAKIKVAADADAHSRIAGSTPHSTVKPAPYGGKDSGYQGSTDHELEPQTRPTPQRHSTMRVIDAHNDNAVSPRLNAKKTSDSQPLGRILAQPGDDIKIHEDAEVQATQVQATDSRVDTLTESAAAPMQHSTLVKKGSINFASLPPRESVIANAPLSRLLHTADVAMSQLSKSPAAHNAGIGQAQPQPAPSPLQASKASVPQTSSMTEADNEDDDDWIVPPDNSQPSGTSETTTGAELDRSTEQATVTSIRSETRKTPARENSPELALPQREQSILYPDLAQTKERAQHTPVASPNARRFADGPLSASKSKLYSVLKSAKSMFASSAGPGTQARSGHLASPTKTQYGKGNSDLDLSRMPGGFAQDPPTAINQANHSTESLGPGRAPRSSMESDKKSMASYKETAKAALKLEKAREKEAQAAAEQKLRADAVSNSRSLTDETNAKEEASQSKSSSSAMAGGPGRTLSRLAKPTTKQQAAKPVPVNIRVPSQSQRLGSVPQPAIAGPPAQAPQPAPAPTRQGAASTRSGATTRAGGASTLKPTKSSRALQAAAKKKELEEQAAQQKADKKREQDLKRKAAEEDKQRAADLKLQQARDKEASIVAKHQEEAKQRKELAAKKARENAEAARKLEQKAHAVPPTRPDNHGTLRQIGKPSNVPDVLNAKASKRVLEPEDGRVPSPSKGSGSDAKRRKTNDVDDDVRMADRPSTMAPPKRPSSIRKESALRYVHAPPPAQHHGQNIFKATVTAQHQAQHSKPTSMYPTNGILHSNTRIPFAESSTDAHPSLDQPSMQHPKAVSNFKTPARPVPHASTALKSTQKSSPAYQNGENIALPEILTDSEEDSESESEEATGGFRAPSWVNSPALRDLLTQQQLVDPESVFGPIAPLHMDDVFRNGKNGERLKKFRDRGSSARWVETGDAVTQEEKKKDQDARAKMFRDGGWSFNKDG